MDKETLSMPPRRRHRSGAEYPTSATSTAITPYTPFSSRFKLPPGWGIEEVPRSDGCRVDRYYYEPGTGLKYRSLKDVERRLNGEIFAPRTRALGVRNYSKCFLCSGHPRSIHHSQSSPSRKMVIHDGKVVCMDEEELNEWAIVPSTSANTLPYDLPDGWVIEEVPRRDGSLVDKYYYEPETGLKFRSRIAVQRYLAEMRENVPLSTTLEELKENKPLSKMFKLYQRAKQSLPRHTVPENSDKSSFLSPPEKVNWVLSSSRGDAWNPFIAGTPIPDSVKEQWSQRFMLFMNDENLNAENSD